MTYRLVNAKHFGVPQDRERVIIVGFRQDLGIEDFRVPDGTGPSAYLADALAGMAPPAAGEVCDAPYSSRYMSRNRERGWGQVSYTIPAMAKQVPLHPSSPDMVKIQTDLWHFGDEGTTRRLSWREAAAIQTFPEDMVFYGDLTSQYKQIGNAVPVLLADAVAKTIRHQLETSGI